MFLQNLRDKLTSDTTVRSAACKTTHSLCLRMAVETTKILGPQWVKGSFQKTTHHQVALLA